MHSFDALIIGGGAAGLAAAAFLSRSLSVAILERNEKIGKKLYITGKGRCNLTNLCSKEEFLAAVMRGQRFLQSAISFFPPQKAVEFFNALGLPTKTERGNRVFPLSDKASDVSAALTKEIAANGGQIFTNTKVDSIKSEGDSFTIYAGQEKFSAKQVILATGGKSYPSTGSDGNGYALAQHFNHSIKKPLPALTALNLKSSQPLPQGLTLKNVRATLKNKTLNKQFSSFGEMLFTDRGVSGPIILTLSSFFAPLDYYADWQLFVDLKPTLGLQTLDLRLLRDFDKNINKNVKNGLDDLLPKSLIPFIISYANLYENKKINSLTRAERERLLDALKNLSFSLDSNVDMQSRFNEAIITCGGVSLKEINPKTMESKLCPNLFIIGEMLDVDALTGGFNLQIAWSTAAACANAILSTQKTN